MQDRNDSSDDEIVQQDARFDYYTMPEPNNDTELVGKTYTVLIICVKIHMIPQLTGLDHIIEIYDFMPSLQTADVAMPFASFK